MVKAKRKQSQKKRPVRNLWSPDYKELTTEDASATYATKQSSLSSYHNTLLSVCNTQLFIIIIIIV